MPLLLFNDNSVEIACPRCGMHRLLAESMPAVTTRIFA